MASSRAGPTVSPLYKNPVYYDGLIIEQDARQVDGLGGEIWNGAYVLSSYMKSNLNSIIKHKSVIELGSGCGLCGLVAAQLGAAFVLLTDEYPDLVQFNVHHNKDNVGSAELACAALDWEDPVV